MPKRALITLATFGLVATACISSSTPAVNYGTGDRFVPFVVDSLDDVGQGDAVALTADGVPYVSYFGFPAKLAKGEIATPRPFGSPTVPAVMLSTSTTDGLWQRGAVEMTAPPSNLDPVGVAIPFGPVETDNLDLGLSNTNGTSLVVEGDGTVHMAWTVGNEVRYATSKLGGSATVATAFRLGQTVKDTGPLGRPSVAVDDSGTVWVAFTVATKQGLEVHAVHQVGKAWDDTVVASFPTCAGCPAPQPTGIGLAGKSLMVAYADPAAKQVRVATLVGTTWSEATAASGVSGFGLSFEASGDAAYAAYYTGSGTVQEATWSKGAWKTSDVADADDPDTTATGAAAANTSVTATSDGTVYVAWEQDGVQLASGTGSFEPVTSLGSTTSAGADPALATSDSGVVSLTWYDTQGQNQMIGFLGDLANVVVARPSPSLTVSQAPTSSAACGKDGKVLLDETAQGLAFQQTCLVAPAGQPFTINFDNQDAGTQHNIAIFTDSSATKNLFRGDVVTGVIKVPYDVPTLDPGSYYFHCDIHPTTMTGTLAVVKGAK